MSQEAMKLALEVFEMCSVRQEHQWHGLQKMQMAEHALREALAEQKSGIKQVIELYDSPDQPSQQEPVAFEARCPECGYLTKHTEHIGCIRKQLNAINAFEQRNFAIVNMDKSPPAQRKPLTNEEIENLLPDDDTPMSLGEAFVKFTRLVEAAHGIKENT